MDVMKDAGIVIDNGSNTLRIGLSGEDKPKYDHVNMIGFPKEKLCVFGTEVAYLTEPNATKNRGDLNLKYPVHHGIITDWDSMEKIWEDAFKIADVNPEERNVLISEPPLNPRGNRERIVSTLFETFKVPGCYVQNSGVLALYPMERSTSVCGCVVECGDGLTYCVPVHNGYLIRHAITRINIGGREVTEYLMKLLRENGFEFNSSAEYEIAKDIKKKLAYVAEDFENESKMADGLYTQRFPRSGSLSFNTSSSSSPSSSQSSSISKIAESYKMPDGEVINISRERFFFIYLFIFICLFIYLFVCLFIYLFVYLFIYLFLYIIIFLFHISFFFFFFFFFFLF
jgi:actin